MIQAMEIMELLMGLLGLRIFMDVQIHTLITITLMLTGMMLAVLTLILEIIH